jgi:fructose-1,6-bisphosphatase
MNILDVEPKAVDQRVPTYLGNSDLVTEFERLQEKQEPRFQPRMG